MPSPKSLRAAPQRTFENYILTLSVGSNIGLTNVPQEKFVQIPGPTGSGGTDDGVSDALNIGFTFSFDGRNHTKFRVSPNGWVILVAPGSTADAGTTINDVMVNTHQNARINSTFSADHVLCAVWYDDMRNVYSSSSSLGLTAKEIDLYEKGLSQPDRRLNPRKYGVQYYNDNQSNEGRRLIIRWNSISDYSVAQASSILVFEFVLYENGKIEYRYAPRNDLISNATGNEDATIGIFMPNGTWRFRDFSYELGYGSSRPRYKFGGAISGSYTDTESPYTVPYAVGLKPETYWPGQKSSGAIFTFQPPLNRRKVLPRLSLREKDSRITLPTVARTGDKDRSGSDGIYFDDRKSIAYGQNSSVNYPTTLPRFYASSLIDVSRNQDLFLEDFVLAGNVISSNVQEYLEDNEKKYIAPFSEYKLFENDPSSTTDSFFTTGSSIKDVGEGFSQPLKSKTQIRLSYRVDHKTTMFGASSSIYYFNNKTGRWQYPTASFANGKFDIAEPFMDPGSGTGRLTEIDRGFNAFGFNIASGSSNRSSFPFSTNAYFNNYFNRESEIQLLTTKFEKSITLNQEYNANDDESITIPINQPFLLEKAVIEIPIEAGPGWFYDRTQCIMPTAGIPSSNGCPDYLYSQDGTTFDIGGPGLTFGLFNQIKVGPNKYVRDLILSGTVTHDEDNSAKIAYFQPVYGTSVFNGSIPTGDVYQIVPRGFLAYATPSGIVSGSNYFFTGSAKFKCQSAISNGVLIRDTFFIDQDRVSYSDYATGSLEILFNSPKFKLPGKNESLTFNSVPGGGGDLRGRGSREIVLVNVNNMGRSMSGFEPSGRSVLGKEYTASKQKNEYENPFYLYRDSIVKLDHVTTGPVAESPKDLVGEAIPELGAGGGGAEAAIAIAVVQKQNNTPSPYLLLPNDRLILSISKSRPFFLSTESPDPFTMNQIQHDIKLTTGSINITLYGSLVTNGKEFHDTLNQPLSSDAIHEVVIGGTKT